MRKSIIIISILALLPFAAQAQHYGFYGRGKSYSKGYVGYHPEGISHRTSGNPAISRGSRGDLGLSTEVSSGRLFGS